MLQDRGALLKHSLSSWLREDVEGKEERNNKFNMVTKEEREGEKREDQTVVVKRMCVNPVSAEAFDIFRQGWIRRVVGIHGVIFGVILVVCLIVVLWLCRVCFL